MANSVYIGLAVTGHVSNTLNTAVFDQVCAPCSEGVASPWTTSSVGGIFHFLGNNDPGVANGGARGSGGAYTLWSASTDIYNNADSFNWDYQSLSGDGTIIARVTGVQNTDPWAKAGVMIRESLNSDAADAYMYLTPGNGLNFISRTATGASSNNTHGPTTTTAPYWVKLVRSGNTFTGYASSDGQNWGSPVGSATISMASSVYVGLAVTSHSTAVVGTATFDNVTVQASSSTAEVDDPMATYAGTWNRSSNVSGYYDATAHWSGNTGDTASYSFTGTGIAWVGGDQQCPW